jgi:ribosomal protein S18 acetylase RimI-like enzyme
MTMYEVVHPKPESSDFAEMGRLMADGFPSKCRHVGMNPDQATKFWEQRWLETNPETIGVIRDPCDPEALLGMIVLKFHSSKLRYNSVESPKHFFGTGRKVGFSMLLRLRVSKVETMFSQVPGKHECYVVIISVSSSARGKGVGESLMKWADQQARALDCRKMTLHVEARNRAIRLYRREGFRRPLVWQVTLPMAWLCCLPISGTLGYFFMVKRLRHTNSGTESG